MRALPALRAPSRGATPWNSPRKLLAVGVVLVAIGIGQGIAGTHHSSPAAPSSSAVGRWEAGLLDAHLLAAGSPLRSHATVIVALPASLSALAIRRVEIQVSDGSAVEARALTTHAAGVMVTAVRITLTPAGRALLLARTLAHATALRLRASLSGSGGGATHTLAVTIAR